MGRRIGALSCREINLNLNIGTIVLSLPAVFTIKKLVDSRARGIADLAANRPRKMDLSFAIPNSLSPSASLSLTSSRAKLRFILEKIIGDKNNTSLPNLILLETLTDASVWAAAIGQKGGVSNASSGSTKIDVPMRAKNTIQAFELTVLKKPARDFTSSVELRLLVGDTLMNTVSVSIDDFTLAQYLSMTLSDLIPIY